MLGRNHPPEGDRSPQERARAAAERAARRASRTGEQPAVTDEGSPEPPPAAEPTAPVPEPSDDDLPPPPPRPRPGRRPPARRRPVPKPPRTRPAPPRGALPRSPSAGPGGREPGGRWGARVLLGVAVLIAVAGLWLANAIFQPFHGEGEGSVEVTIEPGWNVARIGDELARAGVVDNGTFFNLNATLTGNRGELKPGDYTLAQNMSYGEAVDALAKGPEAKVVPTFDVTIPEGGSRREVARSLDDTGLEGDYLKATTSRRALRAAHRLGLPRASDNPEGFLFPATYKLVRGASMRALVDKQLEAFEQNFADVDMRAAKRRNLTRYDVVIIASMVEREAQLDKERPLVAAVIHNRLREGIPLGIDATIRYVENNWTQPLRQSELEREGPYNTRLNQGLPPTPIGNPGLKSLQAAAKPADVDFLYYVVKPGTCGEHAFSSSDLEFQRDVARYNAEREKAGGKSPTTC